MFSGCGVQLTSQLACGYSPLFWFGGEKKSIWVFITIVEKICIQIESNEALAFD